jgi:adenylosuccinate lyase
MASNLKKYLEKAMSEQVSAQDLHNAVITLKKITNRIDDIAADIRALRKVTKAFSPIPPPFGGGAVGGVHMPPKRKPSITVERIRTDEEQSDKYMRVLAIRTQNGNGD